MSKLVRLEINDAGAWRRITRFDADEEERSQEIMDAADTLGRALNWDTPAEKRGITLRVSVDDSLNDVLCHWTHADGWINSRTGEPL